MTRKLLFSTTLADCDVETFRGSGPGGQHRNKVSSAVRVRHRESGAVGKATESRSQDQNKKEAFKRMVETPTYQSWARVKAARMLGQKSTEEKVEEALASGKIREEYRCQYCAAMSLAADWKNDTCPKCGGVYNATLAQEGDD